MRPRGFRNGIGVEVTPCRCSSHQRPGALAISVVQRSALGALPPLMFFSPSLCLCASETSELALPRLRSGRSRRPSLPAEDARYESTPGVSVPIHDSTAQVLERGVLAGDARGLVGRREDRGEVFLQPVRRAFLTLGGAPRI